MKIENLKSGLRVNCPSDRGQNGYIGEVKSFGEDVYQNIHGVPYVWVSVEHVALFGDAKRVTVWPSVRLTII